MSASPEWYDPATGSPTGDGDLGTQQAERAERAARADTAGTAARAAAGRR